MSESYIHGFSREEQKRLSRMQDILNERHLESIPLSGVNRFLDVGSGLGQMTRMIASNLHPGSCSVAVERSEEQRQQAVSLAASESQADLVDYRIGDATDLPLESVEWGSFDLVHTRFLLEHVSDPQAVVMQMCEAVRPGGKIFLMDDDHELLRVWPECRELESLWTTYWKSYQDIGCDPLVGRKLAELLKSAGAEILSTGSIHYGASKDEPLFDLVVDNLIGVIAGTADSLIAAGKIAKLEYENSLSAIGSWREIDSATVWYSLPFAIGVKPDLSS